MLSNAAEIAGLDPEIVTRLQLEALDFQVVAEGGLRGRPRSEIDPGS